MCRYIFVCTCGKTKDQTSVLFLFYWDVGSPPGLNFTMPVGLASSGAPKIYLSLPPQAGIQWVCYHKWKCIPPLTLMAFLCMSSENWTQVLIFAKQAFYQLSYLPNLQSMNLIILIAQSKLPDSLSHSPLSCRISIFQSSGWSHQSTLVELQLRIGSLDLTGIQE